LKLKEHNAHKQIISEHTDVLVSTLLMTVPPVFLILQEGYVGVTL